MLNKEILIQKGFELNEYPEGRFFELCTTEENKMVNILGDDYRGDENTVILQLKEDFTNKLLCVDCNVWNLTDAEFEQILNNIKE
jgi:hypothetical protein